ncbi:hypothetical protein [Streptomyces cylindrosporus]|uniref:Minor tail protein n=1 Tax=Streptomyces cylindrosporus TaxID=2927583 RepID=A0ABS9Y1E5_9ACTN|nr:hypothetical protein [Streptomyces cylindrosporus]MCI3271029.1 hypothetical protein [Streptomyces cylindrosporus]
MEFPLDIRTDLSLGGIWTNISDDVYVRDVKAITRGLRDQGSAADPSSLTLTLDNRAGKYSQRNAMSPLFGQIGRNTPIRVSLPSDGDHYLQLDARTGNYASTPDVGTLDITGDLDVRAEIAPDWYGASNQLIIGKWDRANLQQSWVLMIDDGLLYFRFSTDANADLGGRFFATPLPQLPERAAVRATLDLDNGAGGNTVTFYWAETLDGPWTQMGQPTTLLAGTDPIYSGSAPLAIGITDLRNGLSEARYPMNGRGYRFEVRSGINGTVVAAPDFRALAAGTTSFTDSTGKVWTLSGNAEIRDREDRFVGEVASWPLRWSTDDADRYTSITANGILRRLGQGAKALDSTLRRRIPSGNPVAYWAMEEQQDAVQAYSPIPGVLPASVSSVEWASWDTLPSSAPLPKLTGTSSLSAPVPTFTGGKWQVEFVYNADDIVPTSNAQLISFTSNGVIKRWIVEVRSGLATVSGFTSASATVATRVIYQGVTVGADIFHGWTRLRFSATDDADGSGFTWSITWQDVGGDAGGLTRTYATGSCGSISLISADWPASTEGWGFGHLSVTRDVGSTLYNGSDNAYLGETAIQRMRRLATEERISFTRAPGRLDAAQVGYQRQDSLVNLFEAAADADGGILTEDMRRIGLHYRDRSSLYTQDPAITLSYTEPGLGPDIEPVDDDTDIVNDVTVTRDGGSSARAVLTEGALSVNPAPDGIGKYDAAHTVSLATDSQSEPVAYWRLHLGTWDGARYPSVTLMLHKPGAEWLIPLVQRLREGDKIRLTDLPEWVSHDDVDLLVMGWSEILDLYRWEITLNCIPAGPWNTGVTDDATFSKADTDGTVLGLPMTQTATTAYVRVTDGPHWTTSPAFMPIPIRVAGETMNVTAATEAPADTFEGRTLTGSWGTSSDGLMVWTPIGGTLASDYAVSAGAGKHVHTSRGITRRTYAPVPQADTDTVAVWSWDKVPVGDTQFHALTARYQNTDNYYFARVLLNTNGTMVLSLRKRVAATESALGSTFTIPGTYTAGAKYRLRFSVVGSTLSAKAWADGATEPSAWQLTTTDTALSAAGSVGAISFIGTASTLTFPTTLSFDLIDLQFQAFTVTRAVNGVTKSHSAGEAVNVANPMITSL